MLTVALTGGIATGKSVVAGVWEELGCYIHRADLTAHKLMMPGERAWEDIKNRFGSEILNPDATIDRKKLSQIIFSDAKEREYLNNLLHPLVQKKRLELIRLLSQKKTCSIFVSEAALIIEAGTADFFDRIVAVFCSAPAQLHRLMERDSIKEKEALQRIKSQMPQEEKIKYSDYSINTSGPLLSTVEQAEKVYRYLKTDFLIKSGAQGFQ